MAERLRIIDLGDVSWLRSQGLFHGVAYALRRQDDDTITFCSPLEPYVCVGYHQEVEKEVDVEYCQAAGIPIARREVGGGAVYLDHGQLFWHTIFHQSRVPLLMEHVYSLFLQAPVLAYQEMGIEAYHRPVNDLQVAGKKIGGTGASTIGEAVVVASSLMFNFNYELMARVLKVPSEKFRDKVYQTLREYLTTIQRELGEKAPSRQAAQHLLVQKFAQVLGREVYYDELSPREWEAIRAVEERFVDPAWVFQRGGMPKAGVKIHEGVRVLEAAYKAPGGLIRATVTVRDGIIADLLLSGDFFFYPPRELDRLQHALIGARWDEAEIQGRIERFYFDHLVQSPGVSHQDVARAVWQAGTPA